MKVLQQYFTSYRDKETSSTGFQVKGESPGISASLKAQIARLISYRIPPSLNEQDIASHPVALRYYYIGPDQSILLCSQSCGQDPNGRPGNFFAHTLVLEPEIFTSIPPIFYWKSPLWRHEDDESASKKTSLPVIEDFADIDPSLDIEEVWSFLAQGERRVMLYKLLCAVIDFSKSHRRIVILDSIDNIAYWIAAVSCLLPPAYRPLLSFATYHHEPQQGHYLITGVTGDSSFRTTPDNYASYFILNAETGVTSAVPASPYARMAADAAQPDLYESQLLVMFTDYARRFPTSTSIDEQLDLLALYTQIQFQAPRSEAALEDGELQAIHVALSSFEGLPTFAQEDIHELRHLQQVLSQAAQAQQNPRIQHELARIGSLLKTRDIQIVALEEGQQKELIDRLFRSIASEGVPGALAAIERPVKQLKQQGYTSEFLVTAGLNRLREVSSPRAWQELAPQILKNSLFAPLPEELEKELIHIALSTVLLSDAAFSNTELYARYQNHPALSDDARKTIAAILAMAGGCYMDQPVALYVNRKVTMLLPDEYRTLIKRCMQEFFQYDVTDQAHGNLITALFTWNHNYATYFWQTYWETFEQLLLSPQSRERALAMLSFWFNALPTAFLHLYIMQAYFLKLPAVLANLQQRYGSRPEWREFSQLVARQRWYSAVQSFLIVKKGIFEPITSLFQRSPANQPGGNRQYDPDLERLFAGNALLEHREHLAELYEHSHEQFWAFYWQRFKEIMMAGEVPLISELFSFWFDEAFSKAEYVSYAPQEFYLGLPEVLESARKEQGFASIRQQIDMIAQQNPERYRWYPLINTYFIK